MYLQYADCLTVVHVMLQATLFHDRMKAEEMQKIKRGLVDLEEAFLRENAGAQIRRV